jgi:mannose-6-phosphate isomerase
MQGVYRLKGTVKHYDWGGYSFIPSLLKTGNQDNRPFAEYWMGTHPLGDALVQLPQGEKKLSELAPAIPYLLKVLDVKDMLSIQVHPSKSSAIEEFARENAEGIAIDSPYRNYKDDNHKPEMLVALSDFYLLHGFKPEADLLNILETVPELNGLITVFQQTGYEGLYKRVMTMPQQEVNETLQPLLNRIVPLYNENKLTRSTEDFWAARASITFSKDNNIDRGIFSIYLFNVLHLQKGEALFQGAGLPHAYLEGQNVELMANSDNVLRGGLTPKHVDVKELLKHVKCEPTIPNILSGESTDEFTTLYKVPVPDFQLSVVKLEAGDTISFTPASEEILLLTNGRAEVDDDTVAVKLETGNPSAIAFPGKEIYLAAAEKSTIFRAAAGVSSR